MTQEHDGDMEQIRARVHVALHPEFGPEAYTSEGKNFVIRALAKDVRYLLEREASPGSPHDGEFDRVPVGWFAEARMLISDLRAALPGDTYGTGGKSPEKLWSKAGDFLNTTTNWQRASSGPVAEGPPLTFDPEETATRTGATAPDAGDDPCKCGHPEKRHTVRVGQSGTRGCVLCIDCNCFESSAPDVSEDITDATCKACGAPGRYVWSESSADYYFVGDHGGGYANGGNVPSAPSATAVVDARCAYTFPLPSWAGEDQMDPCRCDLPTGHDGAHLCDHLRSEKSRSAASEPDAPGAAHIREVPTEGQS